MAKPYRALPPLRPILALVALGTLLAGCGHNPWQYAALSERECLARVMYFESNRSSESGMRAVGTVVMNRLESRRYSNTICGVVGQRNQFADGALTKPVSGSSWTRALRVADAVMAGDRHDEVGRAMFFHTAGMTFPYRNMAYVTVAGGNAFYEKKTPGTFERMIPTTTTLIAENPAHRAETTRIAQATPSRPTDAVRDVEVRRVQVAKAAPSDDEDDDAAPPPPRRAAPVRLAQAGDDDIPAVRRAARTRPAQDEDDDGDDQAPAPRRPGKTAAVEHNFDLPRTRLEARSRPDAPYRPAAVTAEPPNRPRVASAPKAPEIRHDVQRREPLVLASVAGRREKAPPTIAELIELDMERPKRR